MPKLLPIRIAAGGIALVLDAVALVARTGGPLRRHSGWLSVFLIAALLAAAASDLRVLPIVLLLGAMLRWLWRDCGRGTLPVQHDPTPLTAHAE